MYKVQIKAGKEGNSWFDAPFRPYVTEEQAKKMARELHSNGVTTRVIRTKQVNK